MFTIAHTNVVKVRQKSGTERASLISIPEIILTSCYVELPTISSRLLFAVASQVQQGSTYTVKPSIPSSKSMQIIFEKAFFLLRNYYSQHTVCRGITSRPK